MALHPPSTRQHIVDEVEAAGGVGNERARPTGAAESSEKRHVEVDVERGLPRRHRSTAERIERGLLEATEGRHRYPKLRTQNAQRFAGPESQPRGVLGERIDTHEGRGDVVHDVATLPVNDRAADAQAQRPLGFVWIERVLSTRAAGAKRARNEQHWTPLRVSSGEGVVLSEDRRARHRDEADSGSCASTESIDQTRQCVDVSPRLDDHHEARRSVERDERVL